MRTKVEIRRGGEKFWQHGNCIFFRINNFLSFEVNKKEQNLSTEFSILNSQLLTGSQSGYDYFGARYYDSDIGRWLSVDPLMDKYPGWSPYNYVMNNPVNLFDPDGMDTSSHFKKALSAAAMGGTAAVVDGPLPFGEIVGGIYIGLSFYHLIMGTGEILIDLVKSDESKQNQKGKKEEKKEKEQKENSEAKPNFEDPSQPPGPGWEWRGESKTPGKGKGAWYNPKTKESYSPDFNHAKPTHKKHKDYGKHYDYNNRKTKEEYRLFPDGRKEPK